MYYKFHLYHFLLIPFLALTCRFLTPSPAPTTTHPPEPTALPTLTAILPLLTDTPHNSPSKTVSGKCSLTANSQLTLYNRPDPTAEIFSVMEAGFTQTLEVRTTNGWLGFDPGVAQAANIGSFRYRWVDPASDIQLKGACNSLPEVWAPPPGICFTMPMEEIKVYTSPDNTSPVLAILKVGDFAAVTSQVATDWVKVDLAPGNTGKAGVGWVEEISLNLNGPCDSLPLISP